MNEALATAVAQQIALKPGQRWAHPKPGPWGGINANPATILDLREGWVRYSWNGNDDQRDTEDFFRTFFSVLLPEGAAQ